MSAASSALSCQIFVGNLPREITSEFLVQVFQEYGQIVGTPTVRKFPTGATGIVTFSTHEEADKALREANYMKLNGRPVSIRWRESQSQHNKDANIVVSNLPEQVEESQLHAACEEFGNVVSVAIRRNKNGVSTGIGFIQFADSKSAERALENLHGAELDGRRLKVELFKPADKRQDVLIRLPANVVAVGGRELSSAELVDLFSPFGKVINTFQIGGVGVVMFSSLAEATRCRSEFNQQGLTLLTQVRKEDQQQVLREIEKRRVYISQLLVAEEIALRALLETVGEVGILEVHPRGEERVAFAQYLTEEARNTAIEKLNGKTVGSQHTPINVVPFFDKRLDHPPAGVLVINEVGPDVKLEDLRQEMSKFGRIAAASLAATCCGNCMAYFLFEESSDAVNAAKTIENCLVLENVDINVAISGFGEKNGTLSVGIYGLPVDVTRQSINETLAEAGLVHCLWLGRTPKSTSAFAYFTDWQGIEKAFEVAAAKRLDVRLMASHIVARIGVLINMYAASDRGNMVYVSGLASSLDCKRLRELFSEVGPVTCAMIKYDARDGDATGGAVVVFREKEDAEEACSNPPIIIESTKQVEVSPLRTRASPAPEPQRMPMMDPGVRRTPFHPRDWVKQTITGTPEFTPEQKQQLCKKVEGICLQEVHRIASDPTGELAVRWAQSNL